MRVRVRRRNRRRRLAVLHRVDAAAVAARECRKSDVVETGRRVAVAVRSVVVGRGRRPEAAASHAKIVSRPRNADAAGAAARVPVRNARLVNVDAARIATNAPRQRRTRSGGVRPRRSTRTGRRRTAIAVTTATTTRRSRTPRSGVTEPVARLLELGFSRCRQFFYICYLYTALPRPLRARCHWKSSGTSRTASCRDARCSCPRCGQRSARRLARSSQCTGGGSVVGRFERGTCP
jgi:hypothetical protein